MCENNLRYSANNGNVTISTANSNLNGSGTLATVLTAGDDGTVIKSIIIKAIGDTTLGMVRLFIDDGSNKYLFQEIMVCANDQTAVVPAFSYALTSPFALQSGYALLASTQNSESFNIVAIGTNWVNCECPGVI